MTTSPLTNDVLSAAKYRPVDGAFEARYMQYFYNRPLYMKNIPAVVLCGDRPAMRLLDGYFNGGVLLIGLHKGDRHFWLHACDSIMARYVPGRMEWMISDAGLGINNLKVEVVPYPEGPGYLVRLSGLAANQVQAAFWLYGGARRMEGDAKKSLTTHPIHWFYDPTRTLFPRLKTDAVILEEFVDSRVAVDESGFRVQAHAGGLTQSDGKVYQDRGTNLGDCTVVGTLNRPSRIRVADAQVWTDPKVFLESTPDQHPAVAGLTPLAAGDDELFFAVEMQTKPMDQTLPMDSTGLSARFAAGRDRVEQLATQVVVSTPDRAFDLAVSSSCISMDAPWYPPVYVHGGMAWNWPYVGWRTLYGPTAYGWHEHVLVEARYYLGFQIKESAKTKPVFETHMMFQSRESMQYGAGWINRDQGPYNMQTQFFDMLIHAWRWTGDRDLEALLLPALELHLDWQQRCFDPDDDGLYESYINTWPTDCISYNGGATAQETAYAYTGHLAAAEMAQRAGDVDHAAQHRRRAEKILTNLKARFWIAEKGYVAEYIEAQGHRRRHEDSCLYSIFLPIDSGMLSKIEAAQTLHYTEWGLERVPIRLGGQMVHTTNWVPRIWSTRELFLGDNFHLALAYYQTGLIEEAWEILKGTCRDTFYDRVVPGAISDAGSTDFNDCSSMFCRVVVEGLFGYRPDYPQGRVRVQPSFPADWDQARLTQPGFSLTFRRTEDRFIYEVRLTKAARVSFVVPLALSRIGRVTLDGVAVAWRTEPGFGRVEVLVETPVVTTAVLEIVGETVQIAEPSVQEVMNGAPVRLTASVGELIEIEDPQGVLAGVQLDKGVATATIATCEGHHLVFGKVQVDGLAYWQRFRFRVRNALRQQERLRQDAQTCFALNRRPQWSTLDLSTAFNADIRTIYQQKYLSPRVNTCSSAIGIDGYSFWPTEYWKWKPPEITLDLVPSLIPEIKDCRLMTHQGVAFHWTGQEQNIVFTSLYDRWPTEVTVPVNKVGKAVWFLIAGSTNHMQTRIANGVLRMRYRDGVEERLELIPPLNYWSLTAFQKEGLDYAHLLHRWPLPERPPETVQLGQFCRAMLLPWQLRERQMLESVTLETLSLEVVIGLMGVTVQE